MKVVPSCNVSRRLVLPLLTVVLGALLVAMPGDCLARERTIGVRLNIGTCIWRSSYLAAGAGVGLSISQHVALMIDGQADFTLETGHTTLVTGIWLRAAPTRKLCPYLALAGGIWGDSYSSEGGFYSFAGPGLSLRFSQVVSAFAETRFKLFMDDDSNFHVGVPLLLGVRIAF